MSEIIVYYSRAGENYFNGSMKVISKGNTEVVAEKISQMTGAPLFKVQQKVPYSEQYQKCTEEAKEDHQKDARPELVEYPEDIEKYDTVILCYPNYWSTMPMAMFTLLEKYDFSGKTIKPLCTNEGSGMGCSEQDIKRLCPGAKVTKGLAIQGSKAAQCDAQLKKWLGK